MLRSIESCLARLVATPYSIGAVVLLLLAGCATPSSNVKTAQVAEDLRRENGRLARVVTQRDDSITELEAQIKTLQGFAPDRPIGSFHPVAIEIASLSGGADYNATPGDDGVTVHLRLRDADGDVVKVAGRISIQLLDTTTPGSPSAVGVCVFDDPAALGRMWHGRFGTNHFTLRCPFSQGETPTCRKLTVNVEFVDYLTGKSLTVVAEVAVSPGGR